MCSFCRRPRRRAVESRCPYPPPVAPTAPFVLERNVGGRPLVGRGCGQSKIPTTKLEPGEAGDGASLGRRLDDDESLGHRGPAQIVRRRSRVNCGSEKVDGDRTPIDQVILTQFRVVTKFDQNPPAGGRVAPRRPCRSQGLVPSVAVPQWLALPSKIAWKRKRTALPSWCWPPSAAASSRKVSRLSSIHKNKAAVIALREIAKGKVHWHRPSTEAVAEYVQEPRLASERPERCSFGRCSFGRSFGRCSHERSWPAQ